MEEEEPLVCRFDNCNYKIQKGETYYLLGGGKVVNCEHHACNAEYILYVNEKPVTLRRGWDKVSDYVLAKIRKTA